MHHTHGLPSHDHTINTNNVQLLKRNHPDLQSIRKKNVKQLQDLVQQHQQRIPLPDLIPIISRLKRAPGAPAATKRTLLQQLYQLLHPQLHLCTPRHLSEVLLTCSELGLPPPPSPSLSPYSSCLSALLPQLQQADTRCLSNAIYAIAKAPATSRGQCWPHVEQQLLPAFLSKAADANTQDVANLIWAVASVGQQLPRGALQQLLAVLRNQVATATTQEIANSLWAVAKLGQHVPEKLLQGLLEGLTAKLPEGDSQHISIALWAAASLHPQPLLPTSLLTTEAVRVTVSKLPVMLPQGLGNIAWACGTLGYREDQLLLPVYDTAEQLLAQHQAHTSSAASASKGSSSSRQSWDNSRSSSNSSSRGDGGITSGSSQSPPALGVQELSNLCWAAAILDIREAVGRVGRFAAACSSMWGEMDTQGKQQLYQVHMWLQDHQPASSGLSSSLSQLQLQQCKEEWEAAQAATAVASKASPAHQAAFAAAKEVKVLQQAQLQLEARTADGLISIDILATTAGGVRIAIEVDGHFSHFRRPDLQPTGTTLWRDRALAARGYVVVSVPYWEWDPLLRTGDVVAQVDYLEGKVQQALVAEKQGRQSDERQPGLLPAAAAAACAASPPTSLQSAAVAPTPPHPSPSSPAAVASIATVSPPAASHVLSSRSTRPPPSAAAAAGPAAPAPTALPAAARAPAAPPSATAPVAIPAAAATGTAPAAGGVPGDLLSELHLLLPQLPGMSMAQLRHVAAALAEAGLGMVATAGPGRTKATVSREIREALMGVLQQQQEQGL